MDHRSLEARDNLADVDVQSVNRDALVDIQTVTIDDTLPTSQRVASYVQQLGNPYCFRVGDVVVKVKYKDNGPSFQQVFEELLKSG